MVNLTAKIYYKFGSKTTIGKSDSKFIVNLIVILMVDLTVKFTVNLISKLMVNLAVKFRVNFGD